MTKSRYEIPAFQLETLPQKQKSEYPFYLIFVKWSFAIFGSIFPKAVANLAYRIFTTPRMRAVHKRTDEIIESARLFEVLYGKIILKGYEWGRGARTILLVHGWESRGTALRSFVPGLVQAGFRVVAFDGPAHGNSQRWRRPRRSLLSLQPARTLPGGRATHERAPSPRGQTRASTGRCKGSNFPR